MDTMFEEIHKDFKKLQKASMASAVGTLNALALFCVKALNLLGGVQEARQGAIGGKEYYVFYTKAGQSSKVYSRPVLKKLFIYDAAAFVRLWGEMLKSVNPQKCVIEHEAIGKLIYTASQAFSCVYDLYKPSSRKTPGTFFEMLMSSLLAITTGMPIGKQIHIPGETYKIPTDIVLYATEKQTSSLVIPTKITTRERIVQPWAHHRIVEDVFGKGRFKTILACVSELQRDGEKGVNEICVPNQVGLFQTYLAELSGLYYADPPLSYVNAGFAGLPVRSLGELFHTDLPGLVGLQT